MEQKSKQSAAFISEKTALILIFIVIAISALIMFVDWDGSGFNNRSAISATSRTSQQSLGFSRRYDEFSKLVLKPNQTYEIVFDESGESGLIDMTGSVNPVKHYSIKTTEGCTVRYTTGQVAYVPPERIGVNGKLPIIPRQRLQFRIKNTEDINSVIITTSG